MAAKWWVVLVLGCCLAGMLWFPVVAVLLDPPRPGPAARTSSSLLRIERRLQAVPVPYQPGLRLADLPPSPDLDENITTDAWGSEIRIEFVEYRLFLRSAGPNRVFGDSDDMTHEGERPRYLLPARDW